MTKMNIAPLRSPCRAALGLVASLWLCACAMQLPGNLEAGHSPAEIIPEIAPFAGPDAVSRLPPVDVLALDDDMRAFLQEIVDRSVNKKAILVNLLDRMLNSGPYVLHYDNLKTHTARETFHAREGNCLSFTNLFIALAREAGLKAHYQEIKVPHNWERQGETWMYNRHINARVDLEEEGEYVVDFNYAPLRSDFHQRRISDRVALSQYYNNMGVYWMLAENYELSYLNLREAISLSSDTAYFWTNLGALYSRVGDGPRAESAWLHALDISAELSAASNLARYYGRIGNLEYETFFEQEVERFRRRNPYYLYETAESAYYAGDYEASISALKEAVRIRDNEEQFYRLLGLNYVRTGEVGRAQKAMEKAREYATTDAARRTYNHKLRMLEGGDWASSLP